jgi:hypothetical protein
VQSGLACLTHEVEHVSLLQSESGMHGQDALDKPAALFGMSTMTQLAHDDAVPNDLLTGIVRRLDAVHADKRPQCVGVAKEPTAHLARLRVRSCRPLREQGFESTSQRAHVDPKARALESTIAHPMPEVEEPSHFFEQCFADSFRFTSAFRECLKLALQVGPAVLPLPVWPPVVRAMSIRHQNAAHGAEQRGRV